MVQEFIDGIPLNSLIKSDNQEAKNYYGYLLMKTTLYEIFKFNFMQSDPNFANFLIDKKSQKLVMLDFGSGI